MVSSECSAICFEDVISQSTRRNVAAGKSNTKRIAFVWSIRDPSTQLAFLAMTLAHQYYRTPLLDLRGSWRGDKAGSSGARDLRPDLPDRSLCL